MCVLENELRGKVIRAELKGDGKIVINFEEMECRGNLGQIAD